MAFPVPVKNFSRQLLLAAVWAGLSVTGAACAATPAAPAPDAQVSEGRTRLHYTLWSHWMPVLEITTDYQLDASRYNVSMQAKAGGLISLFMKMNIHSSAQGRIAGGVFSPVRYESHGYSRGADRSVTLDYPGGAPRVVELTPAEPDREPVTPEQRRNGTDILSAMMKVLSQVSRTGRCDGSLEIFDGIRLTRFDLQTAGTEVPKGVRREWRQPAMRCNFMGSQVAGFIKGHTSTTLKERHGGAIWFETLPGYGPVVVRAEMEHPKIGKATAFLSDPPSLSDTVP